MYITLWIAFDSKKLAVVSRPYLRLFRTTPRLCSINSPDFNYYIAKQFIPSSASNPLPIVSPITQITPPQWGTHNLTSRSYSYLPYIFLYYFPLPHLRTGRPASNNLRFTRTLTHSRLNATITSAPSAHSTSRMFDSIRYIFLCPYLRTDMSLMDITTARTITFAKATIYQYCITWTTYILHTCLRLQVHKGAGERTTFVE